MNTGIANSLTAAQGERDPQEMAGLAAAKPGRPVRDVVVARPRLHGWDGAGAPGRPAGH